MNKFEITGDGRQNDIVQLSENHFLLGLLVGDPVMGQRVDKFSYMDYDTIF